MEGGTQNGCATRQGLGEGEGVEGEDGWDEGEEPGRAWGYGLGALRGLDASCAGGEAWWWRRWRSRR